MTKQENVEIKPVSRSVSMVEDIEFQKVQSVAYTGDHVTAVRSSSKAEKTLFWKSAILISTLAALIYFVAYLDRNSIGNARVAGMQKELKMTNSQYSTTVSMFFVGYIIFMLPANIALRYASPNHVLGGSILVFSAFVVALGAAKSYSTVLALRIMIGIAQAFIQGLSMYTALWFKRDEIATISASYYSAATISGAFSGLIAYGTTKNLNLKTTGREPWRNLYYIDGSVALFVGVLTLVLMPRFPDKIKKGKHWLFTAEELEIACERAASFNTVGAKVDLRQIWSALKDIKSWAFVVAQLGVSMALGTVGVYLPSFIVEFGYSPLRTQLFSTIPYACAFCTLIAVAYCSDRVNKKGVFLLGTISLSTVGYVILLTNVSNSVKIFATCLIISGVYPSIILLVTWLSINTAGFAKRGTTWAMAEISGQCFTIMATYLYTDPPRYIKGHAVILGFQCLSILAVITLLFWFRHENSRKDRIKMEYEARGEAHPHAELSLEDVQDQHQSFRYIL